MALIIPMRPVIAQDRWGSLYEQRLCIESNADSLFHLASNHFMRAPERAVDSAGVSRAVARVERCVDMALRSQPGPALRDVLQRVRTNVQEANEAYGAVLPGYDSPSDSATVEKLFDDEIRNRPIALNAARGAFIAVALRSSQMERSLGSEMLKTQRGIRLLFHYGQYLAHRSELRHLIPSGTGRFGVVLSGYQGNVLGIGGAIGFTVRGERALVMPQVLADGQNGWSAGGEISGGLLTGRVALLPGLVYLPSSSHSLAVSGSAVLIRPHLSMGLSFSTLQGLGMKMILGI